ECHHRDGALSGPSECKHRANGLTLTASSLRSRVGTVLAPFLAPLRRRGAMGVKNFFKKLKSEITEDRVSYGAAALGYYLLLALFPAMILLLSVIPFLPIANVDQAIMDLLNQALPAEAAQMFTGAVDEVVSQPRGGLLSFGILATLWAASSGMQAVMDHLNFTYGVTDSRSFIKMRATAIGLTLGVGLLIIAGFSLIVLGGQIQDWMTETLGFAGAVAIVFAA